MFPFSAGTDSQKRQRDGDGSSVQKWGARLSRRCRKAPGKKSKGTVLEPHLTELRNHIDYDTGLSRLCPTCNGLRHQLAAIEFPPDTPCAPRHHYWPQEYPHHSSFADFRKAIDDFDCHICYILYGELLQRYRDIGRQGGEFRTTWEAHQGLQGGDGRTTTRTALYLQFYYCGSFGRIQAFPDGMKIAHWEEGERFYIADRLKQALKESRRFQCQRE